MSDRYKGAILSPTAPTVIPQSAGGVYTLSQQTQYQGQGVWPSAINNPINNSLRFRSSASAYLNRTFSTGNRLLFTFSAWVKRGSLTGNQNIFGPYTNSTGSGTYGVLRFVDGNLEAFDYTNGTNNWYLATTPVYRDPSAWYHIVMAYDSAQATSSNRVKLYVNGVQVTALGTAIYPSLSYQGQWNDGLVNYIGTTPVASQYFDGYLTEVNFIGGQALTPSSFGTTDAYGIWQPIPYTGSYGTNGFYLPFTDNSALTTSSNAGLGKDFSGNGNYWVTNNISITAGSTYDSMTDVPTNTNSNTANYCVLNPLDNGGNTLSNANLTITGSGSAFRITRSTFGMTSGKWYCEFVITTEGAASRIIFGLLGFPSSLSGDLGTASNAYSIYESGNIYKYNNGVATILVAGGTLDPGDVQMLAYDANTGNLWFGKNGSWFASGDPVAGTNPVFTGVSGQPYFVAVQAYNSSDVGQLNFGQRPFSYTPPSGFYPLNTYNLPTPTILAGNQYMDAVLYSGNSSTQNIAVGFQPDFVWSKCRNVARSHRLSDAVRGSTRDLYSDTTSAEQNDGSITSFISTGFSLNNATGSAYNTSGENYVSWAWKANGSGSSNTQGTITSTVSANTTAGFSIATYTGTGANATVGHGLGVAPSMVIVKRRDAGASPWNVWHSSLTSGTYFLVLNSTAAQASGATRFTALPTSTVINIGTDGDVNANTGTYVAYNFAQIAGYSAFGSYTGNGSTDGPFIFTGFRPRYVMIKSSSTGGAGYDWFMWDSSRNTYNVVDHALWANLSDAENTTAMVDLVSNGFKLRLSSSSMNANGTTYIYMAFAESPFKIARGR